MSNYAEVTPRGIGGRSKGSVGGAFVGLIIVAITVILFGTKAGR